MVPNPGNNLSRYTVCLLVPPRNKYMNNSAMTLAKHTYATKNMHTTPMAIAANCQDDISSGHHIKHQEEMPEHLDSELWNRRLTSRIACFALLLSAKSLSKHHRMSAVNRIKQRKIES